jgi:RsiW-degrading membrane proteinase PrsW (M82 family)
VLDIGEHSFAAFIVLGFIEEIFKFAIVYAFIHRTLAFNEPIDAMLYMIVAGLGFAAAENIASIFRAAGGATLTATVVETLAMRFVGATLLHTVASGTVGYYWGRAFMRRGNTFVLQHRREFGLIAIGLLTATALHAVFNYLIILSGPASFAIVFITAAAFVLLHDFERLKREDVP